MRRDITWLLDVDGVINASRPGWSAPPRTATAYAEGRGWRLRWEPKLIKRIGNIAGTGVDVRWATTWCVAMPELRRVFGIDLPTGLDGERPPHLTWDEMKVNAARAVLAEGRRLVWTDDSVVPVALRMFPEFREAVADGRALLIAPRPSRGLRPEDLDAIEQYAGQEEILPEGLRS